MTRRDARYPHADADPILTGDAVPLEIRSAGLGSRALAMLIDVVVQVVLLLILRWTALVVVVLLGGAADGALVSATGIGTLAVVLVGYPTVTLSLAGGRTLGKLALGLRVLRDDGGPIGVRHAVTRTLVGVAVEFPGVLLPFVGWVIGMVAMMGSRHSRRIGDHAAGTIVVHERTTHAWGFVPVMPAPLAAWAASLDLAGLDDDLALGIRQFLARNRQLREPDRTRLGLRLARQVAETVRVPAPAGTPGWAYLAAVHAERHGRAMRRLLAVRDHAARVWPELLGLPPTLTRGG